MKIKTAVIPVAGKGTRFLPATKQVPKELLPVLNIPMIHYIVEEAKNAGIENIVFISSDGKESLEKYFQRNTQLENFLAENGKEKELQLIKNIGEMVNIKVAIQEQQLGLGHAISCARDLVEDDSFAVLLGDDLIFSNIPAIEQLAEQSAEHGGASVIGVMEVKKEDTSKYGIIDGVSCDDSHKLFKMTKMVEKPKPEDAPTLLATPGRYILNKSIFEYLDKIERGSGGEFQLTDAINLQAQNENVYAYVFDGKRYDTGQMLGVFKASIAIGMKDPNIKDNMLNIMKKAVSDWG